MKLPISTPILIAVVAVGVSVGTALGTSGPIGLLGFALVAAFGLGFATYGFLRPPRPSQLPERYESLVVAATEELGRTTPSSGMRVSGHVGDWGRWAEQFMREGSREEPGLRGSRMCAPMIYEATVWLAITPETFREWRKTSVIGKYIE
jgi:hypothetical protein